MALITLALGIGSTTAVFSMIEAVLLRPLPYHQPDRLVAIWAGHVREKNLAKVFAQYDDFERWTRDSQSFAPLAAATWATGDQVLTGRGPARVVLAVPASVDFFGLLGVTPMFGRTFTRADLNGGCIVVLAHRFWQDVLAARADVVGERLALNGRACTVVGVSPAAAGGTIQRLLARLDPDVPVSDEQTMEERISKDLAYPRFRAAVLGGFAVVALGMALVGLYAVLSALVAQRTHEIGVRMALGAPRGLVLALVIGQGLPGVAVGVTGGLAVAAALTRYLRSMLFGLTPLDPATFILTAIVLTCVAALACYLPARRATAVDPLIALRSE